MESGDKGVKMAKCGYCGIWEECTVEYIGLVKQQYGGVWVCGLCAEAIKDDQSRLGVGLEVAILVHAKFREGTSIDPTINIARSLLQLLRKMTTTSNVTP